MITCKLDLDLDLDLDMYGAFHLHMPYPIIISQSDRILRPCGLKREAKCKNINVDKMKRTSVISVIGANHGPCVMLPNETHGIG